MDEVDGSLRRANDSAEGPDDIYYQLIKHLSKSAKRVIFNRIFCGKQSFPSLTMEESYCCSHSKIG